MRVRRIDILKGILTLQMILAHCIQFYVDLGRNPVALHISDYINLTTFSGFLFCFGYASHLAYFRKEWKEAAGRIFKNALRLLAAFYISSFCYVVFVEKIPLRLDLALEILLLKRLAGWSEFLFGFALVMLLAGILFPLHQEKCKWGLPVMAALSILTCLVLQPGTGRFIAVDKGSGASFAGSLAGGIEGAYFPVIPYGIYFLAGIWFARKQAGFRKIIFALACVGTLWHTIDYLWISGGQPSRFPLSFSFLAGAALFVYLYYLLAAALENKAQKLCVRYLTGVGKNSLFYLLLSNLIIFAVTASKFYRKEINYSIGLFLVILSVIWYLQGICKGRDS